MSTFLNDTFTAANGTIILGRTASPTGGVWQFTSFAASGSSTGTIQSNALEPSSGFPSQLTIYNDQLAGGNDYTVTGAISKRSGGFADLFLGLRYDAIAKSGYMAGHEYSPSAVDIWKVVAGSGTQVATLSYSGAAYTTGDTWIFVFDVVKSGANAVLSLSVQRTNGDWMDSSGNWQSGQTVALTYTDTIAVIEPTSGGSVWMWGDAGTALEYITAATPGGALTTGTLSNTALGSTTATNVCTAATGGTSPYTYQWYRSTSSGFTPGGGNILSGATSLTLNDTGLSASTTYYYKVVSTDNVSATVTSSQLSITTNSPGSPSATIMTAAATESGVTLSLTASGGTAPYSTAFYRSTTASFTPGGGNLLGTDTGATPSYADTTGTAGVLYFYKAIVTDNASATASTFAVGCAKKLPSVRVVFIGDSNMAGQGPTEAPPYVGASILRGRTGRDVAFSNQGHAGAASGDWVSGSSYLNAAKSAMSGLSGTVQAFVIAIGTNDQATAVASSKATYKANVSSMIIDIRADFPSAYIFLSTPIYTSPEANNGIYLYDQAGVDLMAQYRTALAELVAAAGSLLTLLGDTTAYEAFTEHTSDWYLSETFASGAHTGEHFYLHANTLGETQWAQLLVTRLSNILNGVTAGGGLVAVAY